MTGFSARCHSKLCGTCGMGIASGLDDLRGQLAELDLTGEFSAVHLCPPVEYLIHKLPTAQYRPGRKIPDPAAHHLPQRHIATADQPFHFRLGQRRIEPFAHDFFHPLAGLVHHLAGLLLPFAEQ